MKALYTAKPNSVFTPPEIRNRTNLFLVPVVSVVGVNNFTSKPALTVLKTSRNMVANIDSQFEVIYAKDGHRLGHAAFQYLG